MRRDLFVVCLIIFSIDRDSQTDFAGGAGNSAWQRNGLGHRATMTQA